MKLYAGGEGRNYNEGEMKRTKKERSKLRMRAREWKREREGR